MATAKTTTKPETKVEPKQVDENAFWMERVPITLPYNTGNPEDQTEFVSVGNYSAQIMRGQTVMVPRYVAQVLEQSEKAKIEAFRNRAQLQREFAEETARI